MPGEHYPLMWVGPAAVISLPPEIDVSNGDHVREDLLSVINQGATLLVVDMGATTFCDSAGVNALVRAFRRATASATGIRLVVGTPAVLRILAITGVDRLIDVYPSVAAAMAVTDRPAPGGKTPPEYATTHADDATSGGCPAQPGLSG